MKPFGFGKTEKLKSRKVIDALFTDRRSVVVFPLRVKYRFLTLAEGAAPVQAGVSVSKRNFKRAVDRNRLKRLMREAIRLQKRDLVKTVAEKNTQAVLFFIYTGKSLASFTIIDTAITACLQQLQQMALDYENID